MDTDDERASVGFSAFESLVTRARHAMVADFLAGHRYTRPMWIERIISRVMRRFRRTDIALIAPPAPAS
jgi:hypothetical protein